jgi:hypothetical protein
LRQDTGHENADADESGQKLRLRTPPLDVPGVPVAGSDFVLVEYIAGRGVSFVGWDEVRVRQLSRDLDLPVA